MRRLLLSWAASLPTIVFIVLGLSCSKRESNNSVGNSETVGSLTADWVTIPTGAYSYGSPTSTLTMDHSFQIMKHDVTNTQYIQFLQEAVAAGEITISGSNVQGTYPGDAHWAAGTYPFYALGSNTGVSHHYGQINYNSGIFQLTPDNSFLNHPVVNVTWFGAWAFAKHYGLHLPTEQEWEDAARGNTGYDYPWGSSITGADANYWTSGGPFDGGTTPVGYYNGQTYTGFTTNNRPSPYGSYDMAGNVWQWTASFYGETRPTDRVIRGGSWVNDAVLLTTWYRFGFSPSHGDYACGFRCSKTN